MLWLLVFRVNGIYGWNTSPVLLNNILNTWIGRTELLIGDNESMLIKDSPQINDSRIHKAIHEATKIQ